MTVKNLYLNDNALLKKNLVDPFYPCHSCAICFFVFLPHYSSTMNNISLHNMYIKMYGRFCRHLYECWIY